MSPGRRTMRFYTRRKLRTHNEFRSRTCRPSSESKEESIVNWGAIFLVTVGACNATSQNGISLLIYNYTGTSVVAQLPHGLAMFQYKIHRYGIETRKKPPVFRISSKQSEVKVFNLDCPSYFESGEKMRGRCIVVSAIVTKCSFIQIYNYYSLL